MKEYEIVERSSGYWIVDDFGVVNGPYNTVKGASQDVPKRGQLQYPLPFIGCPECGETTHELITVESNIGQEVLMCGECYGNVNGQDFKEWD